MTPAGATGGRLGALFLVVFINLFGFGVVLPVFPFFGRLVAATPAAITLAMAAYSLGQLIGAPLWGRLSDSIGRRPVLLWSAVGLVGSYLVMAVSSDIWALGLARLFGGLMAGNIAAAFAYVGDATAPAARPRAMGLLGAAFGLGFIFGPAVGGLVAGNTPDLADFATVCWVGAGITALSGLAVWRLLPESLTPERRTAVRNSGRAKPSPRAVIRAKPIVLALMLLTLVVIGSAAMMETTVAFFTQDRLGWGPRDVGLAFALIGAIAALLQGAGAAPLAKRFGSATVMAAAIACYMLGLAAMGQAATSMALIVALGVTAIGVGMFNPAFQTLVAAASDDGDRGLVNGLTQGASSLGRVIGPAVSGTIYQAAGPGAPFTAGAACMLAALLLAIGIRHRRRA